MHIDCAVEEPWPTVTDWNGLAQDASRAAAQLAPMLANSRLCTSILFTDDTCLRALNKEWRGKDKPTNVLSFPMIDPNERETLASDGPPVLLGDIALSFETCAREAAEKSASLQDHASHLVIHGLLHLCGFDHDESEAQANQMEIMEIKALAILGIKDPYGRSD